MAAPFPWMHGAGVRHARHRRHFCCLWLLFAQKGMGTCAHGAIMQLSILITEPGISSGGARAIQLALAPVFLLTGIAGLLNVMTGRLARIVDRGRHLWDALGDDTAKPPHKSASYLRTL